MQDCEELSANSTLSNKRSCAATEFQCLNRFYCVHRSWVCDGDEDCPDGSDEGPEQCGTKVECRSNQFRCRNGDCIPGHLQCSGTEECRDGSDEENCREWRKKGFLVQFLQTGFFPSPVFLLDRWSFLLSQFFCLFRSCENKLDFFSTDPAERYVRICESPFCEILLYRDFIQENSRCRLECKIGTLWTLQLASRKNGSLIDSSSMFFGARGRCRGRFLLEAEKETKSEGGVGKQPPRRFAISHRDLW